MPSFSKRSEARLQTCDPRLIHVFHQVVLDFDCTVLCGHRTKLVQNEAFRQGKSKLRWPDSKHNSDPSMAVDVAPYPVRWGNDPTRTKAQNMADLRRFYYFAGYVKGLTRRFGYNLRWGGDWDGDTDLSDQDFNDLAHWEIVE